MAKIFYSVAGEGRGHAVRVRTLTEALRHRHQIVIYAGEDAYRFLEPLYRGSEVEVREIPSLCWEHRDNGRISGPRTALRSLRYLGGMPALVRRLAKEIREQKPDLVLTDFEPALARAAERAKVPYLSLDHQHFLRENDLSSLPWGLRTRARALGAGIRTFYGKQHATIVSSFYAPGIRPSKRHVFQVRSMIRPELAARQPLDGYHLLAYLRRSTPDTVLEALRHCGREVRVYGGDDIEDSDNLRFRPISESGFLDDLVSSAGVVCAAGNQLLGECLFLGKPVLALPEAGNDEQRINAHYLERSGRGLQRRPAELDAADIAGFLACLHRYRGGPERLDYNGTQSAVDAVEQCLAELGIFERVEQTVGGGDWWKAPWRWAANSLRGSGATG